MSNLRNNPKMKMNHLIGRAGEYAVAAQLLLREMNIYWPSVDQGVDLIAVNGCRIQVKTARVCTTTKMVSHHGEGAYVFPLPKTRRIAVADDRSRLQPRASFVDTCDIVVFWGIEQNRFWVVPSALCDERTAFVLGPSTDRFSGSIEAFRDMVKLGYTHQQIANHYDIERSTVTNHINDLSRSEIKPSTVSLARACENAWQNIIDFEKMAVTFPRPGTFVVEEK